MENKNSFTVNFFVKKHRIDSDGKVPIYLRIILNGQKLEMSVYRDVELGHWIVQSGKVNGSNRFAKEINNYLLSVRSCIYEHYKYLRETGSDVTPKAIKNAYLKIEDETSKGKKILALYQEHNDKISQLKNIDFSPATIERYIISLMHTRSFIKKFYDKDDLYLSELDLKFIQDYAFYFKTERKCSHNTTLKYIKNFKKIVNIAIANGDLEKDPFVNFKMTLKKVDRGYLTDEELDNIIKKKFASTRLDQIRDCFVFSCFTGLAYSDLKNLSHDNIFIGNDGKKWIKIKRKKTDNLCHIPILSAAQKILDKYSNDPHCRIKNVLLPVTSNQKMNEYLKEIGVLCEINKNFSSHLARHTFATTVTLNNDVPLETVSKMLGHSSIKMTNIYARLLDKKVGQDMARLNEKLSISTD